jgi:hypothetical protein
VPRRGGGGGHVRGKRARGLGQVQPVGDPEEEFRPGRRTGRSREEQETRENREERQQPREKETGTSVGPSRPPPLGEERGDAEGIGVREKLSLSGAGREEGAGWFGTDMGTALLSRVPRGGGLRPIGNRDAGCTTKRRIGEPRAGIRDGAEGPREAFRWARGIFSEK